MSDGPAAKRAKLDAVPVHLSELTEEQKKSLVAIDDVQSEIDILNEKASDEILKIEHKYNNLRKPHYDKRAQIIKGIPRFWVQAITNHPQLNTIIDEEEGELLEAVTNIEVDETDDVKGGYKIRFFFGPNEYFENEKIEKEWHMGDSPSSTVGTIKWKDGKCLTRSDDDESDMTLFQWLVTCTDPTTDEIAELIKDDLWPNPVQYFINPTIEGEEEYEDEDEDENDGEEDDGSNEDN